MEASAENEVGKGAEGGAEKDDVVSGVPTELAERNKKRRLLDEDGRMRLAEPASFDPPLALVEREGVAWPVAAADTVAKWIYAVVRGPPKLVELAMPSSLVGLDGGGPSAGGGFGPSAAALAAPLGVAAKQGSLEVLDLSGHWLTGSTPLRHGWGHANHPVHGWEPADCSLPGWEQLVAAVQPGLRQLALADCGLGALAVAPLAKAWPAGLQSLDLSGNFITGSIGVGKATPKAPAVM